MLDVRSVPTPALVEELVKSLQAVERSSQKRAMREKLRRRMARISLAGTFLLLMAAVAIGQRRPAAADLWMGILPDAGGHLTVEQAAGGVYAPLTPDVNLAGPVHTYWVKLQIRSTVSEPEHAYLVVNPDWDSAVLFVKGETGFEQIRSGNSVPPKLRPVPSHELAFPVVLEPSQTRTFWIRVENDLPQDANVLHFTVGVLPDLTFIGEIRNFNYAQGIYAGIILAMFAYNFLLAFSLRERAYLFYSIYVVSFGAVWVARSGFLFDLLWPNSLLWNSNQAFYLIAIAVTASALFVRDFFSSRDLSRGLNIALFAIAGFTALLPPATLFFLPQTLAPLLAWDSLLTSAFYGLLGFLMLSRGYVRARLFLLAWLTLIGANVYYILVYFGMVRASAGAAPNAVQVGSAAESILLAFALADRIKEIRANAEKRQQQQTAELEEAVNQRTLELVNANELLKAAAITDPLTGLNNRRFVDISMPRMTAEVMRDARGGASGSLLLCLCDLDHFKAVNDTYGHERGDEALKEIGAALTSAIRGGALLARWGGEEFLLIEPLGNRDEDTAFAERMRQLVAQQAHDVAPGEQLRMTMSLGLAHFPLSARYPHLLNWQEVLILADRCLYRAKDEGRNRWFLLRVNEAALEQYIAQYDVAAAAALCRSQFSRALELGLLELVTMPGQETTA